MSYTLKADEEKNMYPCFSKMFIKTHKGVPVSLGSPSSLDEVSEIYKALSTALLWPTPSTSPNGSNKG